MGHNDGVFAYGIPTVAAEIPRSGSANYNGEIRGLTGGETTITGTSTTASAVFGTVFLSFDFERGSLSGHMKPEYAPIWDAVSLGTYTFRDTTYAVGGTTFAGAFEVPGSALTSSFSGSFTGAGASELLARWQAPFRNPDTGASGMMSGVWIGKR